MKAIFFPLLFTLAFFVGCQDHRSDHRGAIQKQEEAGISKDIERYLQKNADETDRDRGLEKEPNGVQH